MHPGCRARALAPRSAALCVVASSVALIAGCFTGQFAAGRPCQSDDECGPQLACQDGYCGGGGPDEPTGTSGDPDATSATSTTTPGTSDTSGTSDTTSTGDGPPPTCNKLDVLLVLDNSDSMNQWDGQLLGLALYFADIVAASLSDVASFHFGVVSTDAYGKNPEGCQLHGALALDPEGLVCQQFIERPYLTEQDDFDALTLPCFVRLHAGSADEQPMRALLQASSPAFNGPEGCNAGFLRDDALLVVIVIADEDDDHASIDGQGNGGSPGDPTFWWDKLLFHKRGNAEGIVMGALLGEDPDISQCPWQLPDDLSEDWGFGDPPLGAQEGVRIRQLLDHLPVGHGFVSSICGDSFNLFFEQFFSEIVRDACEDFDPEAVDPDIEDPTEGDPSGPGMTSDSDGEAPIEPVIGESCSPDGPHEKSPFCWTSGYGALGTVYRCAEIEGGVFLWQSANKEVCQSACADDQAFPSGCSGNGSGADEWGCACRYIVDCADYPSGCADNMGAKVVQQCKDDVLDRAECPSGCESDPMDAELGVCGPNPYPVDAP